MKIAPDGLYVTDAFFKRAKGSWKLCRSVAIRLSHPVRARGCSRYRTKTSKKIGWYRDCQSPLFEGRLYFLLGEEIVEELKVILESALEKISAAKTEIELSEARAAFTGKNGSVTALMKQMRDLRAEERPKFGQMVNELKNGIEKALEERSNAILTARRAAEAMSDKTDVTMPAAKPLGALHPLTQGVSGASRYLYEHGI